jgi:hypothetical protein
MQDGSMKRQRGRGGRKPGGNPGNRPHESNGPEVKIRGTAAQIYEKYMQYARDAHSSGDRVKYESFLQHAEHYFRIMATTMPRERLQAAQEGGFGGSGDQDERDHDDASGGGLKVIDDASDEDGPEGVAAEGGGREDDFEEFEAAQDGRGEDRGDDQQGRGRRRRGRRRRNEPGAGPASGERSNGPDTEARSALDLLAQRQAAVAGS